MVISPAKQEIQPLTKLVNNPLEKRGRERVLNLPRLTAYYKILYRGNKGRGKLRFLLLPVLVLIKRMRKSLRLGTG
jgi:hypothetical protein